MEHITDIIIGFGYVGVATAVFAESGVFLGAFLPGDSLLFTVGLLAQAGHFHIGIMFILVSTAAILGDNFGYYFGRRVGWRLFIREDSLFFRKSFLEKTRRFYARHGKKAIILARFVPIVRTFAPIFAGIGNMEYRTFILYNIIGGIGWSALMLGLGYTLGAMFPEINKYLEVVIVLIIVVSILPLLLEWRKTRKDGNNEIQSN